MRIMSSRVKSRYCLLQRQKLSYEYWKCAISIAKKDSAMATQQHLWDLWIADVGATGISFARGRLDPTDTMIVHAAPEKLNVEVRDSEGTIIAKGESLARSADTPMARLRRQGNAITREDNWPTEADYGTLVIV